MKALKDTHKTDILSADILWNIFINGNRFCFDVN